MKYEETFYGHRIVVTTERNSGDRWTSTVEVLDTPQPIADPEQDSATEFLSEEDARRHALSRAAGLIDRARQGRGKP
jgi:hypothetical protein